MTFLSPWSAIIAAALAIPALLLLYFLRLRRQRLRVPSTLLWEKTFEDLQANALFQRLRWSVLLILQLLLLIALLLALAQPSVEGGAGLATRTVLLIDRSASMNARVSDQTTATDASSTTTRLDAAKQQARALVNSLSRGDRSRQVMIIEFGATPRVVTAYESNRRALLEAIDSIAPSDEVADLHAALELAGAYAAGELDAEQAPEVVLLSDGCVDQVGSSGGRSFMLRSGTFRFVQIPPAAIDIAGASQGEARNVGITSFSIRREADDSSRLIAFARLVNTSATPVDVVLTVRANMLAVTSIRRQIPAATSDALGELLLTHAFSLPEATDPTHTLPQNVISLEHDGDDDLRSDDIAWVVLPNPRPPRFLLVHPDGTTADPFIHDLLTALEPEQLRVLNEEQFTSGTHLQSRDAAQPDLVVFDRVNPNPLPDISSITFGAAIDDDDEDEMGQPILSWDRQHPVLRQVALDSIVFTGVKATAPQPDATILATGPNGPVMWERRGRGGSRHLAVAFEMQRSNWPLHVSSAVFMQNAIDDLTLARLGSNGMSHRAGDAVIARSRSDSNSVTVRAIAGHPPLPPAIVRSVEAGTQFTLPTVTRAGVYEVSGVASPNEIVAINVLSETESDIRPPRSLAVIAEASNARGANAIAVRPLWPWIIAAAMVLLVIEWLVYCRKAAG